MCCVVYGPPVGRWVTAQLRAGTFDPQYAQAIGLSHDGHVVAGVVFEDWNKRSVVCHIAAVRPFTRGFLDVLGDYAFRDCGTHKVIAPIYSNNTRMAQIAKKMGFTLEAVITDAQPDGDIWIYTVTKDQYRFGGNHGQTRRRTACA